MQRNYFTLEGTEMYCECCGKRLQDEGTSVASVSEGLCTDCYMEKIKTR